MKGGNVVIADPYRGVRSWVRHGTDTFFRSSGLNRRGSSESTFTGILYLGNYFLMANSNSNSRSQSIH